MSSGNGDKAARLREAADQLLKAAYEDDPVVKSITSHMESINTQLTSFRSELKSIQTELVKLNGTIGEQSKDKSIQDELKKQTNMLTDQSKARRLEWALANCKVNSFRYFSKGEWQDKDCAEFVQLCLFAFREGTGYYITDRSMRQYRKDKEDGEFEKQFRDKLVKQLHQLLGVKPRVAEAEHGYAIYYS